MQEIEISEQVRKFLGEHIGSVAQLETLLLLHTNPQQRWQASEIARELRTEAAGTLVQLEQLRSSGLLQRDGAGAYGYAPATPELAAAVTALAQSYLLRRVTIISMIFAKPAESLRAFSDAFLLRKEPPQP